MFKITKKKVAAAAVATAVIVGGATAYGFWTTSGTGTGEASTTEGVANQLSFDTTAITAMYPGDTAQSFTVTVTNDSDETATVTNVKAYITTSADTDCDGSNFLLNGVAAPSTEATAAALDWTAVDLAADDDSSTSGDDTIQFNNKTGVNQDDCKDVTVTLNYVAS